MITRKIAAITPNLFGMIAWIAGCDAHTTKGPAGRIAYEDEGRGSLPVVLLHSFGGDRSHWQHVRTALRDRHRLITIELRGHGQSDAPKDGDFRIPSMAADVLAVVNELQVKRFVLVGHSMGGTVALDFAGAHPDRVAGLVLVDAAGDPRELPDQVREGIKQSLRSDAYSKVTVDYREQILAGSTGKTRAKVLADLKRIPRETVVTITSELLDYDPLPALKAYSGPAIAIVTPANDSPFALHRIARGMDHRIVTGTGHWLHLDRPDEFQTILEDFLKGLK